MRRIARIPGAIVVALAMATAGQLTLAAGNSDGSAPATPADAMPARPGVPLTLYVQSPAGKAFRLVFSPSDGWRAPDGWGSAERATSAVRYAGPLTADGPADPAAANPLTVFVDGPTGYVFAWIPEVGWKFVGHLGDRHPG
jgi:hypothetical protein